MNGLHSKSHESLLHEVVTGDLSPADRRVARMLAECSDCRARFEELRALSSLLDEAAREERATLASLDWKSDAPGTERIAPFVRSKVEEQRRARADARPPHPGISGPRLGWRVLAAAAGVLAVGWVVRLLLFPERERQSSVLLGQRAESRLHPSGRVASFERFTWDLDLPLHGWYSIRVETPPGKDSVVLAEPPQLLREPRWNPSPAELARWPDEIYWRVDVFDSTGTRVHGDGTSAQLSSR